MKLTKRNLRAAADAKRTNRKQELIEIVKRSSLECGQALMELRDDEHWKDTHLSFKEFCEHNFNISGSYLYELIQAVKIKDSLPEPLRKNITNSKEAILLGKVPEPDRAKAVEKYAKLGGHSTPLLREIAQTYIPSNGHEKSAQADSSVSVKPESKPSSKPESSKTTKTAPVYDCVGKIIPLESLAYWEKGKEFGKWIGPVRTAFEKADEHLKTSHPLFSKVPVSVVGRLNQCFEDLRLSMPYCVCPKCNGEPSLKPDGCDFCNSIGMICKADYEKINPPEP